MAELRTYYVICEDNCRFESMTKEQILSAITQAVSGGTVGDIDTGFVTTIKETNRNRPVKLWVGTTAEYNALEEIENNTIYIKTDDIKADEMEERIEELSSEIDDVSEKLQKIITVRGTWAFPEIDAGETLTKTFDTSDPAFAGMSDNPVVIATAESNNGVSLEAKGYFSDGQSTLTIALTNNGSSAIDSTTYVNFVVI